MGVVEALGGVGAALVAFGTVFLAGWSVRKFFEDRELMRLRRSEAVSSARVQQLENQLQAMEGQDARLGADPEEAAEPAELADEVLLLLFHAPAELGWPEHQIAGYLVGEFGANESQVAHALERADRWTKKGGKMVEVVDLKANSWSPPNLSYSLTAEGRAYIVDAGWDGREWNQKIRGRLPS